MLEIGSIIDGSYKILSEIGRGGMSVVYLALNERANKTWAIKEARKDGSNGAEVVTQGLVAETEILKKLNHPYLPSIIDVIDRDDSLLIIMDYIEGRNLLSVLNHNGPQSQEQVIKWAMQLCDVLGYLHSREPAIIYRDLKPQNVMLKPNGDIALLDFGTAREYKETSQGDTTWLGTRGYAAPEQFGGKGQTDARTDIYNLGATMYHLLTGYSPADTNFVIYPLRVLNPAFEGAGIEKVVSKCCEPDPAARYQSCAELMYALEHVHEEDDASRQARSRKWRRFVASCVAGLIGIIGMVGFKVVGSNALSANYDNVLYGASQVEDLKAAAREYAKAIDMKPEEPKAYNELLERVVKNDNDRAITNEERNILYEVFTRDRVGKFANTGGKDYAEFRYNLGRDYFLLYEEGDINKRLDLTKEWLGPIVEENGVKYLETLSSQNQELAKAMYDLSKLKLTSNINAGTEVREIWGKLVEITSGDLQAKFGDTLYGVKMYNTFVNTIRSNATLFKDKGIQKDEMIAQLDNIEKGLNGFTSPDAEINALIEEALNQVSEARKNVTSAFDVKG